MKNQKCKYCVYYTGYYKQGIDGYRPLGIGFCGKHNEGQTANEGCDNFKSNVQKEQNLTERRLHYLDRALESVNTIAGILSEKREDNKEIL